MLEITAEFVRHWAKQYFVRSHSMLRFTRGLCADRRWIAVLLVAAGVLLAACGDGGSTTSTAVRTPGVVATPASSAAGSPALSSTGCTPARSHDSGSFAATLTSGELEREYILYVPTSYTGEDAMPLVVNLHGHGSNAGEQAIYSGLPAKAQEDGFIVVTPQGMGMEPHWNFTTVEAGAPDDVAFISELLDTLESELCIDPSRVYAAGISNGAAMSVTLACFLSDRIAAIAPIAGTFFFPGCPSVRPVSVIAFHGTEDSLVPFEGGNVGESGVRVAPVEDSIQEWAEHGGCADVAKEEQATEHVRLVLYEACDQGAAVELYAVEGGGHTWPGALIDIPLGATTHEISATDLMWAFFEAHPKP
jgi:polyhydroxybutyrate depolymerase